MRRDDRFELFADPHLPWRGGSPYERISRRLQRHGHPGLDPSSTAREVQDALFEVMTREDREILDEIRYLDRRVAIDFLMYRLRGRIDDEVRQDLARQPMPVEMPDLEILAKVPVDLAAGRPIPRAVDPGPSPEPVELGGELDSTPVVDVGEVDSSTAAALLEQDDGR